jgi:hypothetical protein
MQSRGIREFVFVLKRGAEKKSCNYRSGLLPKDIKLNPSSKTSMRNCRLCVAVQARGAGHVACSAVEFGAMNQPM